MLPDSARPAAPLTLPGLRLRELVLAHWRLLTLALLLALGAAVRVHDIVDNPPGFFTDEASFGLNADLIWHTGRDEHGAFLPFLFESFGEYKLPLFIYAEVPFVAVLGRTEETVRLSSAVLGTLTIVTTYLLAKQLFRNDLAALAAAAFLAILPWHIHYSRTGLGDIVTLPLFFSAGFYLFFRAMEDRRLLIPSAAVLALSFYAYRGGWLVVPPLLLLMVIAYRRDLLAMRRQTLIAAGVFLLILLPLARHLVFTDSDRASQAWIFNLDDERSTLGIFWDFYRSYFTTGFLFEDGDNGFILRHYLPGQGVLYWMQLPLILAGIAGMLVRLNRRYLFVLAFLLLYPLTASVSDTSPISSRAILGSLAFSLASGYGLWIIVSSLGRFVPDRRRFAVAGVLVLLAGILATASFASYAGRYERDYPRLSAGYWGWQEGPQEIVRRFVLLQDQYDELYMDGMFNAPSIFFPFYAEGDCAKCRIGDSQRYREDRRQLFALRPENLKTDAYDYVFKDNLLYPGGSVAFVFVEIAGRR